MARRLIVGAAIIAVAGAIGLFIVDRHGPDHPFGLPPAIGCVVTSAEQPSDSGALRQAYGRDVDLDLTQMSNAATITAVGVSRKVPERAVVVALATALQESKLENLNGGDRDSLGLFQQRPSQGWGTPEQIQDPRYASRKFYTALLKVKGWQKMRVTEAAQRVQRSAYPNAYEKWADEAQVMADALLGKVSAAVVCTLPQPDTSVRQESGQTAVLALAEAMHLDYGADLVTQPEPELRSVTVRADDGAKGWTYAHWLVSRASDHGVSRVTFAGREWSADSGKWQVAKTNDTANVVAEVVAA
jgi:hypothetical protein